MKNNTNHKRLKIYTLLLCLTMMSMVRNASAQDYVDVYYRYKNNVWKSPLKADEMQEFLFESDKLVKGCFESGEGKAVAIPFAIETLDSISFGWDIPDSVKGHNHYRVFTMNIYTDDVAPVASRDEWKTCLVTIDGKGEYSDYSGFAQIKGRGNSTWLWYDKKPYKIKLDSKHKILGLAKAKDWNLLANYRDVTDMMNTFAFEAARLMKIPNTNHSRFLEVFLNGEYIGVYQLTERIEVGDNRVNIDKEEGVLMCLDQDDGPDLSPDAKDNMWSEVYKLPICVKYPDEPTTEQLAKVKTDFAVLENAVTNADYNTVDSLMDIRSFISIIQLHEYLYNVEIDAPRSLYLYKDKGGKYTFGPVWDWDAGYDFDWSSMMTGHHFFESYKELIYGTDPVKQNGAYKVNRFFVDMFKNEAFVLQYKDMWRAVTDSIFDYCWEETQKYVDELNKGAYQRESERWPVNESYSAELKKMRTWLLNRKDYLEEVVANYPVYDSSANVKGELVGEVSVEKDCYASLGYHQTQQITIDKRQLTSLLGNFDENKLQLLPLNNDGGEGTNTAAGTYGAWFGDDGSTARWAQGHVYIESNDLYSWNFGCHPENCAKGENHKVRMQYQYVVDGIVKMVNVNVSFKII